MYEIELEIVISFTLLIKALAATLTFHFFRHTHKPVNQPSIPGTIERSSYQLKTLHLSVARTAA